MQPSPQVTSYLALLAAVISVLNFLLGPARAWWTRVDKLSDADALKDVFLKIEAFEAHEREEALWRQHFTDRTMKPVEDLAKAVREVTNAFAAHQQTLSAQQQTLSDLNECMGDIRDSLQLQNPRPPRSPRGGRN